MLPIYIVEGVALKCVKVSEKDLSPFYGNSC